MISATLVNCCFHARVNDKTYFIAFRQTEEDIVNPFTSDCCIFHKLFSCILWPLCFSSWSRYYCLFFFYFSLFVNCFAFAFSLIFYRKIDVEYFYITMLIGLVWFYGISTIVGLTLYIPNSFLCKKTVLFQTI